MTDDRRKAFRKNAFTFGAVERAEGASSCMVWDVTETGAQIEVEDPTDLPERFGLRLSEDSQPRPAAIAWRRGRRIGVVFED